MHKLLLVDDDADIIRFMKAVLREDDREFITATDGIDAVEKAFFEMPDLVILDVMMPRMNGYQVCRLLKNDHVTWEIPVMMVTAQARDRDRFYSLSVGADDFLSKPFNAQDLKDKVNALLVRSDLIYRNPAVEVKADINEASILSRVNSLLDRKLQQLTFLQEMTQAIVSTFDEEKILDSILRGIASDIGYNRVAVFFHDDSGAICLKRSSGFSAEIARACLRLGEDTEFGRLFRKKQPIILSGAETMALSGMDADASGVVRQQCVIPVLSRGEATGAIFIEREHGEPPFSEERVGLLATLAGQLGLALQNATLYKKTLVQSITDGLTSLCNARNFYEVLEIEIARARRYSHPLSLLMLDIDFFKHYNDTYGHLCGDDALKHVSHILRANSRETDTPARYGGEEFCVILPETDSASAVIIAERIRATVEADTIDPGGGFDPTHLTISIGVATLTSTSRTEEEFVHEADTALYNAKNLGRNRVCVAGNCD